MSTLRRICIYCGSTPGLDKHHREVAHDLGAYLARQGTIAGPPEHCVERLHEVASYGVQNIVVSQFVSDQYTWMRTFADHVLPALR